MALPREIFPKNYFAFSGNIAKELPLTLTKERSGA
jgi:hypothetical protein